MGSLPRSSRRVGDGAIAAAHAEPRTQPRGQNRLEPVEQEDRQRSRFCPPYGIDLLAEFSADFPHVATPVGRECAALDITAEAAVRPVAHAWYASMLHGIEVNIVDVARQIVLIADRMFPVAALPDAFSRLATLLALRARPIGRARENLLLMRLQRNGKSASSLGSVQMACK